jgi:hypothetical protein
MDGVSWLFGKPSRDPELGKALRRLDAVPGNDEALRQRIVAAARSRLNALCAPSAQARVPSWWEWLDRWIPVALPVGLAASVGAALLLPGRSEVSVATSYPVEVVADSTLVTAAYSEEPGSEQVAARLIAPLGGEWLFEQAVIQ